MNQNPISKFLATFNVSTHSIAAGLLTLTGFYVGVPPFKAFVDSLVAPHPKLSGALAAAIGIALTYKGSHSTQGQAAQLIATAKTAPIAVQDAVAAANAQSPSSAAVVSVTAPRGGA
jgi:hypothetical protein